MSNKKKTVGTPKVKTEAELLKVMEQRDEAIGLLSKANEKIESLEATIMDLQVSSSEENICPLATMFSSKNPLNLNSNPKFELERIFYTYTRHNSAKLHSIVKAIGVVPANDLSAVDGYKEYIRYVEDVKKLQENSDEMLYGIQLSFDLR